MTALEFAINMELDGQKYYLALAEKNTGNKLHVVFTLLADEEKKHAGILQNYSGSFAGVPDHDAALSNAENVFTQIEFGSKPELKMYIEQADVYREAREKEKQSVALYRKMLSETSDAAEKELFAYLVTQEEEHFSLMDALVELLDRSKKVVSAEFGMTNDY